MDEIDALLAEQVAYYRARAAEYDQTAPIEHYGAHAELTAALERFSPRGEVLEIACGTGQWTAQLARFADHLTALDSSPEMLAICRERIDRSDVDYVEADVFTWAPARRYDVVFFAAWLSHVPPQRFTRFWELVAHCLTDGGRVFAIDERPPAQAFERRLGEAVVERALNSGRTFRAVKVFYEPDALVRALSALGWTGSARAAGWRFFWLELARE